MTKTKKKATKLSKITDRPTLITQKGTNPCKKSQSRKQMALIEVTIKEATKTIPVLSTSFESYTERFAADFLNKSQTLLQQNAYKQRHVTFQPLCSDIDPDRDDLEEQLEVRKNENKSNGKCVTTLNPNKGYVVAAHEICQSEKFKIDYPNNKTNGNITISSDSETSDDTVEMREGALTDDEDIEFNFLKHNTHEIVQENKHEFSITLYRDAVVFVHGLISLCVVKGSVKILGYKIKASDKAFNVYSPAGSSLLSISNCTNTNGIDTAEVRCKKLDTHLSRSLSLYAPKNMFPPIQNNGTQCIVNSSNYFENFSLFVPSPKWEEFAKILTANSRVIIAGNKGTGKSTLLRYLVNQLLSKDQKNVNVGYSCVMVIDLDPGQPEFTPSGCISIVMVKSPLLGPSYTHQLIPEKCIQISNVDIKYNMDEYICSCKYLLRLSDEYSNIPTLVNYIGYSKGLGQELISTIISYVNPTNVVQLNDPYGKYNFRKDLTIENVNEDAQWMPHSKNAIGLSFDLIQFETIHNIGKMNSIIYTPGQFRDISIIAYFSTILTGDPLCLTDPDVRIYSAPLNKLKIRDSLGNSHPAISNANLVCLCRKVSFESRDAFHCLGWGVVRCVSIPKNLIYLVTPLEPELLEDIGYLIVSSVRLPLVMYITTAKDILGQIPYIEGGQQTALEKPSKRQHYNWEMANQ